MAKPSQTISVIILYFLLITPPHPTQAIPSLTQLRTLFSLSHSLFSRVANLRASRGDVEGARRAELIAAKLNHGLGLGLWPTLWSMGWDYLKNYAWRDTMSFRDAVGIVGDLNELVKSLNALGRLRSDSERVQWIARNFKNVIRFSKSMFNRALTVFSKSGPLRELVEILQKEMEASQYTHVDDRQEL
ncbi:ATP synthase subunit b-delta [Bienertia sinuspersici]